MDSARIRPFPLALPKKLTLGKTTGFEFFWVILGGLPLYLPIIFYLGELGSASSTPIYWFFWANLIISMPHTWATYARLTRKISEKKVHWAFGWPAYGAVLAFLGVATWKGFFLEAFTAVNVWQSYHYLRQFYGVSRLYGRSEAEDEFARKLSFWAYHLAIPLFVIGRWDLLYTAWGGKPSEYIIPVAFPHALMTGCWVLAGVAVALGLWGEAVKYKNSKEAYNCTGLIILALYFWAHWMGFISMEYFSRGFLMITVYHAVQYVGIVFMLEEKQKSSESILTKKMLRLMPHGLAFLAFWVFLFLIGQGIQEYVFTLPNVLWAQFSATCLATISAHHYLVDTVLWGRKAGV